MFLFKKNKTYYLIFLLQAQLFWGWGYKGHQVINRYAVQSFPQEMSYFVEWAEYLAEHGSDADWRKGSDPTEGHKHYIDIDNYDEFNDTGGISQNFHSLVVKYGQSFVDDQGVLPWAIIATMDSLESAFRTLRFDAAKQFAADLGHYVADAHMPLHLTRNYDGQYTNQRGIHSRYESNMINEYVDQISYAGESVEYVHNVPDFVFGFLYENYESINPLLLAEAESSERTGSTTNRYYYEYLWHETKDFTISLFKSASSKLAALIYTAWVNAGKPVPIAASIAIQDAQPVEFSLAQNYPNPFNPATTISYTLANDCFVNISVFDVLGKSVETVIAQYQQQGRYSLIWNAGDLPDGTYFMKLETDYFVDVKKMTLVK